MKKRTHIALRVNYTQLKNPEILEKVMKSREAWPVLCVRYNLPLSCQDPRLAKKQGK